MKLKVRWALKRALFTSAASIYLLLVLLPASRWLVRWQTAPAISVRSASDKWQQENLAEAAEHPDDFAMQFAAALQSPEQSSRDAGSGQNDTSRRLWELRTRFPNEPALYASVLRHLTGEAIRVGRDEEQHLLLSAEARAANAKKRAKNPDVTTAPTSAKIFIEAARAGEKLDPANAFFPMMQTVGLFAENQDAAALDSLHRASQMQTWNDYASAEVFAGDKLIYAAHGETGSMAKTARYAGVLFPHLAQLRGSARVAVALAVRKELAGDIKGGWAIRYDVARCGAVMQNEASSYIGSLVGTAIGQMAMSRPGGQETPDTSSKTTSEERSRFRSEQFLAYAERIGHSEDAAFVTAQKVTADEAKAMYRAAEERSIFGMKRLSEIVVLWGAGSALVSNAAVVLLLGGIAFGLAHTPRIREGKPLHSSIRWGIGVLAAPIPCGLLGAVYADAEGGLVGLAFGLLVAATLAIVLLGRGTEKKRSLAIFAVTLPASVLLLAIFCLGASSAVQIVRAFGVIIGMSSFDPSGAGIGGMLQLSAGGVIILLPLLWIGGLAIASRLRKVPVSVGVVRGAASSALVFASLLLFGYAATVFTTLRVEKQAMQELTEMARHEGRYFARLAGRTWPSLPADR